MPRKTRPTAQPPATQTASDFERVQADAATALARYDSPDARLADAVQRIDRWVNYATGLGTYDDKTRAGFFEYPLRLTDFEVTSLASGNDLAAKIIEKRPKEMFRRGYELEPMKSAVGKGQTDKSLVNELYSYCKDELQLDLMVRRGLVYGRQYGGSLLVLGVDDGQEVTEPLDVDNLKSFRFINGIDRRFSYVLSYYSNFMTPKFGRPEIYLVSNGIATSSYRDLSGEFKYKRQSPQKLRAHDYYVQKIHESRLIRFDGVETDDITRMTLAGWSWSVLQRPYEVLRQCDQSFDSLAYLLSDMSQGVLSMKGLIAAIAGGNETKVKTRMEIVDKMRSVLRTIAVDADSEKYERKPTPLTGAADVIDRIMQRVAAAADMPLTELFGLSPAGLNATGESDRIKWYDTIQNEQTSDLEPVLLKLYKLAAKAKDSPFKGRDIDIKIHFKPLLAPTEKDLADTRLKNAQRDVAYIDAGVIQPEKVTLTLTDIYPSIDVEEIEAEIDARTKFDPYENEPPPPNPQRQPNPAFSPNTPGESASTAIPRPGSQILGTPSNGKGKQQPDLGKRADASIPAPDGEEIAAAVHAQLGDDYAPDVIAWVKQRRFVRRWSGPVRIPIDKIDMTGREKWQATREPEKVEQHAKNIANGREKPVILAKTPEGVKFKVLDGHHRTLAAEELLTPVIAYVAYVTREHGPWDSMHAKQKENGTEASYQLASSRQMVSWQTTRADFDPDQARDETGKWTAGGGGGAASTSGSSGGTSAGATRTALQSAIAKIRAAPAAIGRAALHQVKETFGEFKNAALGLKNWITGHEVTSEQRRDMRRAAVSIVAGIVAAHVTPLLPLGHVLGEGAAKVGEKILDQVTHHVIEHLARKGLHLDASTIAAASGDPEEWLATEIAMAVADALDRLPEARADFDPDQPRDEGGKWTSGGGESASAGSKNAPAYTRNPWTTPEDFIGPDEGSSTEAFPIDIREVRGPEFHAAFEKAFDKSPFTNHVTHYTPEELSKMRTFMTEDGKAGIAVHDHGDGRVEGTALFNQGAPKGTGLALLSRAVGAAGVNYLECYGEGLKHLYQSAGFKVESTARFNPDYAAKTWDYERFGKPNYYTMRLPSGTTNETVH